jgi:hypothetical protein
VSPELQIILAVATPIGAAVGSFAAVRVYLRWHWSEIQRAHTRIDRLEERFS